jgi:hypothetical protein
LILRTASRALSAVAINGRVTCRNFAVELCEQVRPSVSAVMPVWSDTKNTVRCFMVEPETRGWRIVPMLRPETKVNRD